MLYVDGVDGIGWLLQVIGILRNVVRKKTGLCGENSQRGGRGLTQTHSIFFSLFSNSGAYKMAKKR